MRLRTTTGMAAATAAALLFGTSFVSTVSAGEGKVHCAGVNACKGQSACKSANNACKGQNSCKGKGFLEMTQKECSEAQAKLNEHFNKGDEG